MPNSIYLTKEGYTQYMESIKETELHLQQIRKQKGEMAIQQSDDWRNGSVSFDDEKIVKKKLDDLRGSLDKIVIIESSNTNDTVDINSVVTLELTEDGEPTEICTLKLIATPLKDFKTEVSINAPLGKAIFSKRVNDEVKYEVNGFKIKVKILNIE